MPRVIVKCRYYKNAATGNLSGLMKYIAMREGVEKLSKDQQSLPETDNQREFISQIVNRNSYIKTTPEYKYYLKEKTRGAASEMIASAVENNPRILNTEDYLRYMALRPRAERIAGEHGLFSSDDVDLDKAVADLEKHTGNVYSVIVSLKREDAERLGYNKAERWRDMVRAHLADIAKQHNIDFMSLKWYGAFHNESHHPHIHLLLYSNSECGISLYLTAINPNTPDYDLPKMPRDQFYELLGRLNSERMYTRYNGNLSAEEIEKYTKYSSFGKLADLGKQAVDNLINYSATMLFKKLQNRT